MNSSSTMLLLSLLAASHTCVATYLMYLTGQHDVVPDQSLVSEVTHVALAFMRSEIFNAEESLDCWPLFTTVDDARSRFGAGTAILVAIGGWGDTDSFSAGAATVESRKRFARNVKAMVDDTGADGVDLDWEYPGGNGEDYRQIPNSEKAWEVDAYPRLLSEIRKALGSEKIISAAVPGLPRDMLAFTKTSLPRILESVDFLNIMTYDLMNRRDNVTEHHTGIAASSEAIESYLENGLAPHRANLGFAFYIKWFKTDSEGGCLENPIGCGAALMEDPTTGGDLGRAGAFSWHDNVPSELSVSFGKAMKHGQYDGRTGGHFYWDQEEQLFWSWDTPEAISEKLPLIFNKYKLGGVFAWGLGEDAPDWKHLRALNAAFQKQNGKMVVDDHQSESTAVSGASRAKTRPTVTRTRDEL